MASSLQAYRVGSGGISIPIVVDAASSRQGFNDLRNMVAQASKDMNAQMKAGVQIDFDQTAFTRGLETALRRISRDKAKIQVGLELDRQGLAGIASEIGILNERQMRAIRTAGAQSGGTGGGLKNFDSMIGLTSSARHGSGGEFIASQRVGAATVPGVGGMDSVASLRAANAEYQKRLDLEKQFSDESEEDEGKSKPSRSTRRRSPNPTSSVGANAFTLGLTAYAVREAVQTLSAGVAFGNASFVAGSSNKAASLAGQTGIMDSINSIPIIGSVTKLFDEASGFTRALKVRIEAEHDIRTAGVDAARLTFNRVRGVEAEGAEKLTAMQEKYALQGINIDDRLSSGELHGLANGTASNPALADALRAYAATKANVERTNARALQESQQENNVRAANTEAEKLRTQLKPWAATLRDFDAETASQVSLADPAKVSSIAQNREAQRTRMAAERERSLGFASFDSETKVAAAQTRVLNFGQRYADEEGLTLRRELQRDIDTSPEEGGFKKRATLEALAEARAFKASLMVRGGGTGEVVNPQRDLIGDPLNLEPQLQARGRAQKDIDAYIKSIGGESARDLSKRTVDAQPLGGKHIDTLVETVLKIFEVIKDTSNGRGYLLAP